MKTLVVEADHFQILLGDRCGAPFADTTDLWRSDQPIGVLADCAELVGVSVARFGGKLTVEVDLSCTTMDESTSTTATDRDDGQEGWDRLGEFLLCLPTGELIVWGPEQDPESAMSLEVGPGLYACRAYSTNTARIRDEMAVEGPDRYRIVGTLVRSAIGDPRRGSEELCEVRRG